MTAAAAIADGAAGLADGVGRDVRDAPWAGPVRAAARPLFPVAFHRAGRAGRVPTLDELRAVFGLAAIAAVRVDRGLPGTMRDEVEAWLRTLPGWSRDDPFWDQPGSFGDHLGCVAALARCARSRRPLPGRTSGATAADDAGRAALATNT